MPWPTNPAEQYYGRGGWGWDGTQWRKLALTWGYTARWAEDLSETKSGAGNYVAGTVAVPAGYVYVAQFMYIRNVSGSRGNVSMRFVGDAVNYYAVFDTGPVQYIPIVWSGNVPLEAGDSILITMNTCLDGDVVQAGVWGYKMAVG